jgi:hypothetical protein
MYKRNKFFLATTEFLQNISFKIQGTRKRATSYKRQAASCVLLCVVCLDPYGFRLTPIPSTFYLDPSAFSAIFASL